MVSLKKGGSVSLSKEAANMGIKLSKAAVGLGWDCADYGDSTFDLDAWALVQENGEMKKKNLVYFGNVMDSAHCIRHCGDNLTGAGDGDDETIEISLDGAPSSYEHILIGVTIYRGNQKRQSFSQVNNTFIRIYDQITGREICKYADGFKGEAGNFTTLLFGVLSRKGNEWEFTAFGRGNKTSSIPQVLTAFTDFSLGLNNNNTNNLINGGQKRMAVSLSKGGKVSLAKVAADAGIQQLTKVIAGLAWDTNRYSGGGDFDLDAAAFMCGENGKVRSEADFIFYNQKKGAGIEHTGDNRTGEGDGDDEQIKIDLTAIPADVTEINFTVTIHTGQTFGEVENARIRLVDEVTGTELLTYDLSEDYSVENALVFAKLYRHNGEWKFNAIGSGFAGGLAALCGNFGVAVG